MLNILSIRNLSGIYTENLGLPRLSRALCDSSKVNPLKTFERPVEALVEGLVLFGGREACLQWPALKSPSCLMANAALGSTRNPAYLL